LRATATRALAMPRLLATCRPDTRRADHRVSRISSESPPHTGQCGPTRRRTGSLLHPALTPDQRVALWPQRKSSTCAGKSGSPLPRLPWNDNHRRAAPSCSDPGSTGRFRARIALASYS
jgi:hypothetical protein